MKRISLMTDLFQPTGSGLRTALPLATGVLAIIIFIFDTTTHYEIAAATFYVIVVLLSLGFCRRHGVVAISAACILLTVFSYGLTPSGNNKTGLINSAISISAIVATTFLALAIEKARAVAFEARAQLAHIARVTTLGELVASIAHEVNQPLTAIVTNANACARWIQAGPPNLEKAAASIRDIVTDTNRASEIIVRVRKMTTPSAPIQEWIDVNDAIEEVLSLMQGQFLQHHIALRTSFARETPKILGDKVQLQQVMLNLLLNAIDAVNRKDQAEKIISIVTASQNSSDVLVSVQDTGIGVDAQTEPRLFDAFYSTKSGGMGMGLAICRSIVEAHGGRIWATPAVCHGAILNFTLPRRQELVT